MDLTMDMFVSFFVVVVFQNGKKHRCFCEEFVTLFSKNGAIGLTDLRTNKLLAQWFPTKNTRH